MDGPSSNTRPGNGGQGETSSREGREQTRRPTKMKRQRGGPPVRVACAECRRLKLRCSEEFPCHNCVKKGCAAICPQGSMTTGKGNRFVIAGSEVLHSKIDQLSGRVRQLEDALTAVHSMCTREPHPLLHHDLLLIKNPLEREKDTDPGVGGRDGGGEMMEEVDETVDAFGSLAISKRGRSAFFGHTATSWYMLQNDDRDPEDDTPHHELPLPTLPADIQWLSQSFPFSPPLHKSADYFRRSIKSWLPSASVVREIVDTYYSEAGWMTPLPRDEFYRTTYLRIYEPDTVTPSDFLESHDLAVLYMLLAVGLQIDPKRPLNSPEATQYFHLGRAALSLDSPLQEHSTVAAVQAMIGLHRDGDKFNFSPEETAKRRSIMWEVYTFDLWQVFKNASFMYGRPPAFSIFNIDTKMPYGTTFGPAGELEMSFPAWKHRFISQCVSVLQQQVFSSRMLNYKTILELDKKIRDFYIPPSLLVPGYDGAPLPNPGERPPADLTFERHMTYVMKEMCVFYMHRGFFAKALEEFPEDPLASQYAQSVTAVYNTACKYVGITKALHSQQPILTERLWFLYGHVFSCAMVFASIAERSRMALAQPALANLEGACHFFEQVTSNPRANKVVPVLQKMKERARNAFQPQVYAETQARFSGSYPETSHGPGAFPPTSALVHPYPSTVQSQISGRAGPQRIAGYSNPGPIWQDYNNPVEDYGDVWPGLPPADGQPQHQVGVVLGTAIVPGSAATTTPTHQLAYADVPHYSEYPASDQVVLDTDLDTSWQNFMQMFYQRSA